MRGHGWLPRMPNRGHHEGPCGDHRRRGPARGGPPMAVARRRARGGARPSRAVADGLGSTPGAQRARPSRAVAGSGRSRGRVIAKCDPRGGRQVAGPAGVLRDERNCFV
jgi:hypothetical protein